MTPLAHHIADAMETPYDPGKHDCITFLAGWVDTVSGSSELPRLKGSYLSKWKGIVTHGACQGVCEAVRERLLELGWQEVPADGLRDGDIVLTDLDHPGIFHGASIRCQPMACAGSLQLHPRHAKGGLRWQP